MTHDNEEPSAASAGSVAGWAVMDGTKTLVGYHSCSRDKAEAWAREHGFSEVVPLYRSPTLTDEEVKAVEWCIFQQAVPQKTAVTMRRMLERMERLK